MVHRRRREPGEDAVHANAVGARSRRPSRGRARARPPCWPSRRRARARSRTTPAGEAVHTIAPPPEASSARAPCFAVRNTPVRLTSSVRRQTAGVEPVGAVVLARRAASRRSRRRRRARRTPRPPARTLARPRASSLTSATSASARPACAGLDVERGDARALAQEALGRRAPDPARRAGDERALPREPSA